MENSTESQYPGFLQTNESCENDDEINQITRRKEVLDLVLGKLIDAIKEPPEKAPGS